MTLKIFKLSFGVRARVMVFNTTFNNISVKEWRSVLLVEEAREKVVRIELFFILKVANIRCFILKLPIFNVLY
jgi:hypothetical protein